jgi:5-bromo-4-chloroindolyl phosphate hydrolysis protein
MRQINDQIERELSSENTTLIKRYDREMVSQSMATATRQKHLRTLLTLSRLLNKNWEEVTKDDIDELVFEVSIRVQRMPEV